MRYHLLPYSMGKFGDYKSYLIGDIYSEASRISGIFQSKAKAAKAAPAAPMPEPSIWSAAAALEVAFADAEFVPVALPDEEPVVEGPPVDAPPAAEPVEEPGEFELVDDPFSSVSFISS